VAQKADVQAFDAVSLIGFQSFMDMDHNNFMTHEVDQWTYAHENGCRNFLQA